MENNTNKVMAYFFSCMGTGFIILCIKIKVKPMPEMLRDLSEMMAYSLSGMPFFGLGGMLTMSAYIWVKKN